MHHRKYDCVIFALDRKQQKGSTHAHEALISAHVHIFSIWFQGRALVLSALTSVFCAFSRVFLPLFGVSLGCGPSTRGQLQHTIAQEPASLHSSRDTSRKTLSFVFIVIQKAKPTENLYHVPRVQKRCVTVKQK